MKNELKQELTRRLCACNNGGLVLVMYDIYFGFSDDVKNALVSEDREALRKGCLLYTSPSPRDRG